MSVQAMAWVLEHSKATGNDRLVLLAIANHASKEGTEAWPSVPLIAREARVSQRTVTRALKRLAALGELEVMRGQGMSQGQYRPNLYAMPGVTLCPPSNDSGVTPHASRGDKHGKSGVTPVADKPSLEPSKTGESDFCPECGATVLDLIERGERLRHCSRCKWEAA